MPDRLSPQAIDVSDLPVLHQKPSEPTQVIWLEQLSEGGPNAIISEQVSETLLTKLTACRLAWTYPRQAIDVSPTPPVVSAMSFGTETARYRLRLAKQAMVEDELARIQERRARRSARKGDPASIRSLVPPNVPLPPLPVRPPSRVLRQDHRSRTSRTFADKSSLHRLLVPHELAS